MNDRDSNTRAFKMNSQLNTRAQRAKRHKRRQAVLITIMVLLAAVREATRRFRRTVRESCPCL